MFQNYMRIIDNLFGISHWFWWFLSEVLINGAHCVLKVLLDVICMEIGNICVEDCHWVLVFVICMSQMLNAVNSA